MIDKWDDNHIMVTQFMFLNDVLMIVQKSEILK